MDSIFSNINIEINRPTIKNLYVYDNRMALELLKLDEVFINRERFDNLLRCLEYPFSNKAKENNYLHNNHIRLTVEYISEDEYIREKTLFFEFNNYILEFTIPKVSDYTNIYYLRHIHELDISIKNKRKLLGTEDVILTADQIDELLKQDKIHQII